MRPNARINADAQKARPALVFDACIMRITSGMKRADLWILNLYGLHQLLQYFVIPWDRKSVRTIESDPAIGPCHSGKSQFIYPRMIRLKSRLTER